ncbi:MAG: type IX secretion system sortase PorU [Bacteroidia bacterium]
MKFQDQEQLKNVFDPDITSFYGSENKKRKLFVQLIPIRFNRETGLFEKLTSFDIELTYDEKTLPPSAFYKKTYSSNSVLVSGDWYKIAVTASGVQMLDNNFFIKNNINIRSIDPRTIKIFGNGAGMLPQVNSAFRYDDLFENAIYVAGESDGRFDAGDYVLFFGQSQFDSWTFDSVSGRYFHQNNIYSDTTYYFLTFGGVKGKRISNQTSVLTPAITVTEFDNNFLHENELYNLKKSGRTWVGELFDRQLNQNFSFDLGYVNKSVPVFIRSSVVAHSFVPSNFTVSELNSGSQILTQYISFVVPGIEYPVADFNTSTNTFTVNSSSINLNYSYNQPLLTSQGWLDFIEVQSRNALQINGYNQFIFRDHQSVGSGKVAQFNIASANPGIRIWDLTNKLEPKELQVSVNSGTASFIAATDSLRDFVAFYNANFFVPQMIGKLTNQNLHALPQTDYLIVTNQQFINDAQRLASIYSSKIRVEVVSIDQIYNEFSSGSQDVCAIRDFVRMFYKRAVTSMDQPKYLLLMGRASYDYKYRISNNTNFIPTYESIESFDPTASYNSDDFYGFLDDNEGTWDSPADNGAKLDLLDIGIGRFPVTSSDQAEIIINKILGYKSIPAFGDWRNKMVFVTDNSADGDIFVSYAETIAEPSRLNYKRYNVQKLYSDAYEEVEQSGGARCPDVQSEIVKSVERGALFVNYTGHGGQAGWSADRILNTDDIKGWTNGYRLPLFLTATCEFSPFDDPALVSAGEYVLLNPNGGGIGLFSTVRLTTGGANDVLNHKFFDYAGFDSASAYHRLNMGDIFKLMKNATVSGDKNDRNFTFLGDPALMLAYPQYNVSTTSINAHAINAIPDSLKAFSKVTISGMVTDLNNVPLGNFNGILYPTVYDKAQTYSRLPANAFPRTFKMQNNVIYRGKATVADGKFSFSFIVPKDITYQNGFGKISYYANNNSNDANGYYDNIIVGGTGDSAGTDKTGPQVDLFMNDLKFVNGGLTNESPMFIANLKDASGINITGQGIGRDLQLTLTNPAGNLTTTSVNDYYQGKLDTYQEGEVNYRFKNLSPGKNSLKLRAWDVYNNMSEGTLDFVVATSADLALQHVLNYPNPFTTHTTFHFDHNKAGEELQVTIQVFTISGKLIKTLFAETVASTGHFDQVSWDGRDDFGDHIGKGVYVYKVIVKSNQGKSAEQFQKLVILN